MNIKFDFEEIAEEFQLVAKQANYLAAVATNAVAQEIHKQWNTLARSELHSSRSRYLDAIRITEENDGSLNLWLDESDSLVNWVENGIGAFDMKEGFKNSPKVKFNKQGGWYLTVPFRIGTPNSTGTAGGIMARDIYQLAKQLIPSYPLAGGGRLKGTKLTIPVGSPAAAPRTRQGATNAQTGQSFGAYTHKSGIYDGMVRQAVQRKTGSVGMQYNTLRRVGQNSDPNSWIHTGIIAHNLLDKAVSTANIEIIQENAVDAALKELGF